MPLQAANDPTRKGILVPLGLDRSIDLLKPVPGLTPDVIHRRHHQVLIWRPDKDFASCLPLGIECPSCKARKERRYLAVGEALIRNVRLVMASDGTIFMIGCSYRCKHCAGELGQLGWS